MNLRPLLASALVAVVAAGCWVEPAPQRRAAPGDPAPAPTTTTPPPRISIETGKTLHVSPGNGVGVFVTYASGGQWTISWTCDTNVVHGRVCPFDIGVGSHGLHDLVTAPPNAVVTRDTTSFHVRTSTGATLDSARFRTAPGGAIALSMRLNGQPYPHLVFFVSSGRLATAPTDPIELVPSAP